MDNSDLEVIDDGESWCTRCNEMGDDGAPKRVVAFNAYKRERLCIDCLTTP